MTLLWRHRNTTRLLTGIYYEWPSSESSASFADIGTDTDSRPLIPQGTSYSLGASGLFSTHNAAQFTNTDNLAVNSSNLSINTSAGVSLIVACSFSSLSHTGESNALCSIDSYAGNPDAMRYVQLFVSTSNNTTYTYNLYHGTSSIQFVADATFSPTVNTLFIAGVTVSAISGSSASVIFYRNGVKVGSTITMEVGSLATMLHATLANGPPGFQNVCFSGKYGELIIAPRVLTATEMLSVATTLLAY